MAECKYLLYRSDRTRGLCDNALKESVVGATTNFLPAVRPDVCLASCDQPGWRTLDRKTPKAVPEGTHLGQATIVVERSY